ncbi:MAG: DUF3376 domain-containing protein, partial [Acidimicrobiia bacterium]|nr:DUF3376 domain-containing protein [Acidimicrobiia bacterium]
MLSDLKRSLALKFDSESLVDDMAELDRHNRRVGERRAAREALLEAAVVSTVPASRFSSWATTDSLRIGEVLTDPSMAVATHPFPPVAPVGSFDGWPGLMRTVFDRQLSVMLEEQYRDLADPLPVLALGDTVETLLVLTQQVVVDRQGVSPEKFLYCVRLLVEVLHSIWEQTWTVEAALVGSLDSADDVVSWIERVASLARAASENVPVSLLAVLQTGDDLAFHEQLHAIHQFPSAGRASDWEDLGRMWEAVADQANHLIAAAGDLEDPVVDALRRLGADGLRAYAAATAPLHRRVMRGESPIKFIRVSGSNETPFAPWFSATKRVMAEDGTVVNRLAVEDKLAGNQLVNFGAFFSAQWRANDWMWGRLDTAASLVDLLADSTRWVAHTDGSWQEMERLVRGCVRMPLTAVPHAGWMEHLAQLWKEAETDIRAELQAASLAPDVPQELPHTKRLLVSRLQADILASDIRWVAEAEEVEPEPTKPPTADFDEAKTLVGGLTAGTDRIPFDLEPGRWSRIGMRLGLNAWPALMPAGRVPRAVLGAIKPVFLFTLAALVFPRRTLTAGVLGYAALAVGRWEVDTEVLGTADLIASNLSSDYHTWQRWAACVVAVGLAAALALTDGRQASLGWFKVTGYAAGYLALGAGVVTAVEQHWTWTFVLLGVVVVGFGLSAFDRVRAGRHLQLVLVLAGAATGGAALAAVIMEVSIVPIVVPVAAVAVTALAMRWMRLRSWLICFVVTLAPYMAVALVPGLSPGWWALISFVLAVSAVTVYVTYFEVFPPRKRGDLTLPGTPQSTVDS